MNALFCCKVEYTNILRGALSMKKGTHHLPVFLLLVLLLVTWLIPSCAEETPPSGTAFSIYGEDAGKALRAVKLSYFPPESTENSELSNRFILICPGGGYRACNTKTGEEICKRFAAAGITAFCLTYRTGTEYKGTPFLPQQDLGNALRYIQDHAETFHVTMEDYALAGFSAGGNLTASFCSQAMRDFLELHDIPLPGTLILGYPQLTLRVTDAALKYGASFLVGPDAGDDLLNLGCAFLNITADYPPVYIWWSDADTLVLPSDNEEPMIAALESSGIPYAYDIFHGYGHGEHVNDGEVGETWFLHAIQFWDSLKAE